MKRLLTLFAAVAVSVIASAQEEGALDAGVLSRISSGYSGTPSEKAVRNALNAASINVLAENSEKAVMDTHFSDEVPTKGRTDQKSSGRCWLFTGLNVLRASMIEKYDLGSFTFSQNYIFFYDQLEKANLFLQGIIDTKDLPDDDRQVDWLFSNPIGDGGTFTGVANLVMKYGLVPSEVMPETYCSNNTSQMRAHISNRLREGGLEIRAAAKARKTRPKDLQTIKENTLKDIYHILALCLGVPPKEFTWTMYDSSDKAVSTETYTPLSFYQKYIGTDLENGYVMLMNDPCREYYKLYEIQYDRHVYDGTNWTYLNLPMEDIKEMAIASIKGGTAMYFSCDVAKFLDRKNGIADIGNYDYESLLGVSFNMDKKDRVRTHASGSSHAMTLIAVDIRDGESVKWMVENSWGANSGYKGNIIMTDQWFDEYMFRLVVERKYVPARISSLLDQTPTVLPAWDPMFLPEE